MEQKRKKHKDETKKPFLRVLPLGGLGEIGKNMMAIEYLKDIVLIDCGIMFPDDESLGVDLILPDYNYVKAKQEKVKAILITHGHEDHIGAIPFFYRDFSHIPIYAPQLAMELIKSKLDEHNIKYDPDKLIVIESRTVYKVTNHFKAEFVPVNHSISDSFAIALHTPIGTIVHTGDFKIEFDPIDKTQFDFFKFSELGEKGVLLLMSDSTNVEKKYSDTTEKEVGTSLSNIVRNAKGRVIVSTFASNISRVAQLVGIAVDRGRKVVTFGRNMESNFEIGRTLGYINVGDENVLNQRDLKNYPEDKQMIITTGSQGEPMSALTLISKGMHKAIKIKPSDTVIISASVIPGNDKAVSRIINDLFLQGAEVFYEGFGSVHVSGHGPRENLQLMLRMVKPKFFLPVHGEPRHLIHHARMAEEMGWSTDNVILARNGDLIEVNEDKATIIDHVVQESVFVDGNMVGDVKKLIRERKAMSEDGVLIAIAGVRALDDRIECIPDVISKGFFFGDELKNILDAIKEIINNVIIEQIHQNGLDYNAINSGVKKAVEKYVQRNFNKNPMVITRIVEIDL